MNLVGKLLIAPPVVKGNFWNKTVVMVTEHHQQGTMGLVLNKRSELSIKAFGEQLGFELEYPGFVYIGGPVNVKNLSFLHTPEWRSLNTMQINEEFCISSAEDILPRMSSGDLPNRWRIMLGICGWAPGQLLGEMRGESPWKKENAWCTAQASEELVFGNDHNDQWCSALDRSGLEFAQSIFL
jgi:putative transcriptional regulator